jgi:hypothetical protein
MTTKSLKVERGNELLISERIALAEGRSSVRTLDAAALVRAAERAEMHFEGLGIPKHARKATLVVSGGELLPNAYGHTARCTMARLGRNSVGWRVEEIWRGCNDSVSTRLTMHIDDATLALYVRWGCAFGRF